MDRHREYVERTTTDESSVGVVTGWWGSENSGICVFLDGWSDSGSAIVVHGQVVVLGVRGGMSDGVGVWRRPCRRPESAMPAAMVEPHRVVRWSFLTIVIPT